MNVTLKKLPVAFQYLRYKLVASDAHGLHSPFIFSLYNHVIRDKTPFYIYRTIESARANMLLSDEKIEMTDFGTGGKPNEKKIIPVSLIAKKSVKPDKYGQLLFRLVNYFHPSTILELGTSLGITTMYLAATDSHSKVISVEGCPEVLTLARDNFKRAGFANIDAVQGEFGEVLPGVLNKNPKLDFIYVDGNHRKEATLSYFEQCLKSCHENTVIIFDDIHWSREMEEAWKRIQQHEDVTLTLDLFSMGIVFFRKIFTKQHFVLKF